MKIVRLGLCTGSLAEGKSPINNSVQPGFAYGYPASLRNYAEVNAVASSEQYLGVYWGGFFYFLLDSGRFVV
jgi:hypothetical protein